MNIKQYAICAAVIALLMIASFGTGYWSHKPVSTTKTEIQTVEKVVEKKVFVRDNSRIDTTVTKPDGTVEHTVTQNNITAGSVENTVIVAKRETKEQTVVSVPRPEYSIAGHVVVSLPNPLDKPSYEVVGGYRVLGEAWVEGVYHFNLDKPTKGGVGLGVRIGF